MASVAGPSGGGDPVKRPVKKNAFLLFCEEKRMELEAKGQKFSGFIPELIELGSPYWEKMGPEERAPFVERARLLRENPSGAQNVRKITPKSFNEADLESDWGGSQLAITINKDDEPEDQPKKKLESQSQKLLSALEIEEADRSAIYNSLFRSVFDDPYKHPVPVNRRILFIHFGTYVTTKYQILPAEFCIAEFNITEGLIDRYGAMIDPGAVQVPLGYMIDVVDAMKRYGYEKPGYNKDCDPYKDCMSHIINLIRKNEVPAEKGKAKELVNLYTMPEHVEDVDRSLRWLMDQTGHTVEYSVKCVQTLMEVLLAEADRSRCEKRLGRVEIVNRKFEVHRLLKNLDYLYGAELACEYHQQEETIDKMQACSMHKVKSWVFNLLKYLAPLYDVYQYPDKHYPKYSDGIEFNAEGEIRLQLKSASGSGTPVEPLHTPAGCTPDSRGASPAAGVAGRSDSDVFGSGEVLNALISPSPVSPVPVSGKLDKPSCAASSDTHTLEKKVLTVKKEAKPEPPKKEKKEATIAEMLRAHKPTEFMQPFKLGQGRGRHYEEYLSKTPEERQQQLLGTSRGRGHPIPWFEAHPDQEKPYRNFDEDDDTLSDHGTKEFLNVTQIDIHVSDSEDTVGAMARGRGQFISKPGSPNRFFSQSPKMPGIFKARSVAAKGGDSNYNYEGSFRRTSTGSSAAKATAGASQGRGRANDPTTAAGQNKPTGQ